MKKNLQKQWRHKHSLRWHEEETVKDLKRTSSWWHLLVTIPSWDEHRIVLMITVAVLRYYIYNAALNLKVRLGFEIFSGPQCETVRISQEWVACAETPSRRSTRRNRSRSGGAWSQRYSSLRSGTSITSGNSSAHTAGQTQSQTDREGRLSDMLVTYTAKKKCVLPEKVEAAVFGPSFLLRTVSLTHPPGVSSAHRHTKIQFTSTPAFYPARHPPTVPQIYI